MGVLLVCDSTTADCYRTTQAAVTNGRPSAPEGWYMVADKQGALIVACCERHFDLIRQQRGI